LRYYLVYRALVRAKVALLRKSQHPDADVANQALAEYGAFAHLAERFIGPSRTLLIITHGCSGSGKSTYASQLAQHIGAIQIRSDCERKRLFGHDPLADTGSGLDHGIYTPAASEKTYQRLAELAKIALEAGFPVIVDAAFLKAGQRQLMFCLAQEVDVKFYIIDFHAVEETLYSRIEQRQSDPSEATDTVLQQQLQTAQPFSEAEKRHVITVNTERGNALEKLMAVFESA
jgi:uncharacterized protein